MDRDKELLKKLRGEEKAKKEKERKEREAREKEARNVEIDVADDDVVQIIPNEIINDSEKFGSDTPEKIKVDFFNANNDVLEVLGKHHRHLNKFPYDYNVEQLNTFFGALRLSIIEIYLISYFIEVSSTNAMSPIDIYDRAPASFSSWKSLRFSSIFTNDIFSRRDRETNMHNWFQLSTIIINNLLHMHQDVEALTKISIQDVFKMIIRFFNFENPLNLMKPLEFRQEYFDVNGIPVFGEGVAAGMILRRVRAAPPLNTILRYRPDENLPRLLKNLNSAFGLSSKINNSTTLLLGLHTHPNKNYLRFSEKHVNPAASDKLHKKRKTLLKTYHKVLNATKKHKKNTKLEIEKQISNLLQNPRVLHVSYNAFKATCQGRRAILTSGSPKPDLDVVIRSLWELVTKRAKLHLKLEYGISGAELDFDDEEYDHEILRNELTKATSSDDIKSSENANSREIARKKSAQYQKAARNSLRVYAFYKGITDYVASEYFSQVLQMIIRTSETVIDTVKVKIQDFVKGDI